MTKKVKPQSEIEYIELYIDSLQNELNKLDERLPALREKLTELETDKHVLIALIKTVKKMKQDKQDNAVEDFNKDLEKVKDPFPY